MDSSNHHQEQDRSREDLINFFSNIEEATSSAYLEHQTNKINNATVMLSSASTSSPSSSTSSPSSSSSSSSSLPYDKNNCKISDRNPLCKNVIQEKSNNKSHLFNSEHHQYSFRYECNKKKNNQNDQNTEAKKEKRMMLNHQRHSKVNEEVSSSSKNFVTFDEKEKLSPASSNQLFSLSGSLSSPFDYDKNTTSGEKKPNCPVPDQLLQNNDISCKNSSDIDSRMGTDNTTSDSDSELSNLSGLSDLSGQEWKPTAKSLSWVQKQIHSGVNPRDILSQILVDGINISPSINDSSLWRILATLLSEPPKRQKLKHINTINDVLNLLRNSKNIIVLTGAGVSVSCGIPDFRSSDGIYSRLAKDFPDLPDPQAMFDINYFCRDPRPFYKFAREIYPGQFQPSPCHRFIKLLEKRGKLLRNYTQNIDTLEQVAGIKNVIECHGSFATASCTRCKYKTTADVIKEDIFIQRIPLCPKCQPNGSIEKNMAAGSGTMISTAYVPKPSTLTKTASNMPSTNNSSNEVNNIKQSMIKTQGEEDDPSIIKELYSSSPLVSYADLVQNGIMKPDIVFFGEGLPDAFHSAMAADRDKCDLLIVIGSSLKVRPVALIPNSVPPDVPQILINREQLNHLNFDVELLGDSDVIINQLCHLLGDEWTEVCWNPNVLTESRELKPEQSTSHQQNQHQFDDGNDYDFIKTHKEAHILRKLPTSTFDDTQDSQLSSKSTTIATLISNSNKLLSDSGIETAPTEKTITAISSLSGNSIDVHHDGANIFLNLTKDLIATNAQIDNDSHKQTQQPTSSMRHSSIDSSKDSGICESTSNFYNGFPQNFNEDDDNDNNVENDIVDDEIMIHNKKIKRKQLSSQATSSHHLITQNKNCKNFDVDELEYVHRTHGKISTSSNVENYIWREKSTIQSLAERLYENTYYFHSITSSYVFPGAQVYFHSDAGQDDGDEDCDGDVNSEEEEDGEEEDEADDDDADMEIEDYVDNYEDSNDVLNENNADKLIKNKNEMNKSDFWTNDGRINKNTNIYCNNEKKDHVEHSIKSNRINDSSSNNSNFNRISSSSSSNSNSSSNSSSSSSSNTKSNNSNSSNNINSNNSNNNNNNNNTSSNKSNNGGGENIFSLSDNNSSSSSSSSLSGGKQFVMNSRNIQYQEPSEKMNKCDDDSPPYKRRKEFISP